MSVHKSIEQVSGQRLESNGLKAGTGNSSGAWLSLMDYSMKRDLSLSTLRRYIKASRVDFKLEGGRYFIWDEGPSIFDPAPKSDGIALIDQLKATQTSLQKAQEEIAELKTLIAYYEERLPKTLDN